MSEDLARLVDDLLGASVEANLAARKATQRSAQVIRDQARRLAPRTGLPHYAKSITYETKFAAGGVTAEIGPVKGGQGSLGAILEFGTSRTPPHAHMGPAFDREVPNYLEALAKALDPLR